MSKHVLFITAQPPHGSCVVAEQLQMAMVFGAFEQQVSLLFIGDGVYALMKNQQTDFIGFLDFSKNYAALENYYDINAVYVDKESLFNRGLDPENLLIKVSVLEKNEVQGLMHEQDAILTV